MAQIERPTIKLYKAAARALSGTTHSTFTHIALDEGDMATFDETNNVPAEECVATGLTRAAATVTLVSTSVEEDTVQAYHEFTSGGHVYITGFEVMDADTSGNIMMWCALAAPLEVEVGDKLSVTGKVQIKLGV